MRLRSPLLAALVRAVVNTGAFARRHGIPLPSVSTGAIGLAVLVVVTGVGAAPAQVVVTNTFQQGTANVFTVSSTDLFQTNISLASTTSGSLRFGTTSAVNDGAFGQSGNSANPSTYAGWFSGSTFTFELNVAANPSGYTITQLDSYASWDSGRDGQEYTVSYSTVAAPTTFTTLTTIPQFNPAGSGNDFHTRVTITDQTGVLATGVASVRYTFTDFENGGTIYREFDGSGFVTSVPEPAAGGLAAVAGLGVAWLRRRAWGS